MLTTNALTDARAQGAHRSVTRTLGAIEAFVEGLEGCLDGWFADFIVPCGVHHRGKTIRRCSDRAWLSWVVGRDRVRRSVRVHASVQTTAY